MSGWIGVDLDGTLAHYDKWRGMDHIGDPIIPMMERVRAWLDDGIEVRIFTARVHEPEALPFIENWLESHGLGELKVTNIKDFDMVELWDDRAIRVVPNTGQVCCGYKR